ncbi:MAG: nitrogenase [Spirochaetaceae bacterium]|nr:nitrogenase [Spirochaetaceae bacterium]
MRINTPDYVSTTNPCKVCGPLGVSMAIKGIENAMSIMHGSQGCATYIRRYMISHFKEPLDIASSSFNESTAIFGGKSNLEAAIGNVNIKYKPELIAVAPTCLSDTIGDDVKSYCRECAKESSAELIPIKMPSYTGAHLDGFYAAVKSVVEGKSKTDEGIQKVNLFPSMISPADLRYLRTMVNAFYSDSMILPDYSSTLDGEIWGEYLPIAPGGTPLKKISAAHLAEYSISFSPFLRNEISAGAYLEQSHQVRHYSLMPPVGVRGTDEFLDLLGEKSGKDIPEFYNRERARLIDAYADCHKYTFGKKAVVYGDADFVAAICSFLDEVGINPLICASGSPFNNFKEYISNCLENIEPEIIEDDVDFKSLEKLMEDREIDFMIGNSKGYPLARKKNIPLVRCGFPVHDRVGGPRFLHVGYGGALNLLDNIVNTLLTRKQDESTIGYSYL